MSITVLTSLPQLVGLTTDAQQISVIDFHAVWCGPCKVIAPVLQKLSTQYAGRVKFFKCDVDQAKDVAQHFRVSAMPTFVVLKGQEKLEEMKGANPAGLEALVRKHAPAGESSTASGSGSGSAKGLEGFTLLNSMIDTTQVSCLNEDSSHTVRDLLKGGGDKWLCSDCDEQLLINIPFQQTSRVRALRLTTLPPAFAQAPKTIRLFVNNPNVGFDDAESLDPAQEVEISEAQARGEEVINLRFVRFQSVSSLQIFVSANQGEDDVSRIDKLEVLGVQIEGTDMSQLQKNEHDHDHS